MSNLKATTLGYSFHATEGNEVTDTGPNAFLYPHHSPTVAEVLVKTAQELVNPRGKGIYATDETPEGIEARFVAAYGEEGNDKSYTPVEWKEKRRRWRECLYETLPTDYISGVILYSETLIDFQLAPVLTKRGIIPGVRADTDAHPLPMSPSEPATQGLDDLLPRLQAAKAAGARFTKWRAPILCTGPSLNLPSQAALEVQAESLARFAAISQQAGLVPIVEPDIDWAGSDADLRKSVEVHVKIISMLYARCAAYGVLLEGSLIKPSFAQPGLKHPSRANVTPEEIALATATALARSVPIAVAGIVFLSGGLSDSDATTYLNALNVLVNHASSAAPSALSRLPPLTFSFGRGLQGNAMQKWVKGDEEGAKKAFEERARVCSAAAKGECES
jgi:fructose-bisphosphate aldolase class I